LNKKVIFTEETVLRIALEVAESRIGFKSEADREKMCLDIIKAHSSPKKIITATKSNGLVVKMITPGNQLVSSFNNLLDVISIVEENEQKMVIEIRIAGSDGKTQVTTLKKDAQQRLILSPEFKEIRQQKAALKKKMA